jgi:aspartyl-tRNA(Asn)/glutamyl-tRNA(Gln) amidotransferase subunit A
MDMTEQLPSTIVEAGELLRSRRISSLELTQALLDRARSSQDTVAAFITLTDEAALASARKADAELAAGTDRGPLHGIPLAIKDIIATSDAPTTANSRVLDRSWGERADATVVRKLRDAGAVILGKLGLNEYAIGWPDPTTGFRIPKNPWDLERSPGGSSSGTAAAVAAGLILGGLGTDTGGSIRGPAAYCGISGIKPTFGRVSKEGCVPLGYSLDNIGPMAWTARDCALMLQVLAGHDPLDLCTAAVNVPDMLAECDGSARGLRVGVPRNYFFDARELTEPARLATLAAIDALARAGASVVDVAFPHAALARPAQRVTMFGEAYAYHETDLRERPQLYGQYTRQQLRLGALFTAADYVQAQRVRRFIKDEAVKALADVDVLVTPTMLGVAPTFASHDPERMLREPTFMAIWNLTGLPALSVCCGVSAEGLPIGLQIVGKPFDEPMVFKVGDAYQRMTDWHTRRPPAVAGGSDVASSAPPPAAAQRDPAPNDKDALDAILERASLPVSGDEYELLLRAYPLIQDQLAQLRLTDVRYGEPAMIFRARSA